MTSPGGGDDFGYYTIPVILSMEGIEKSTNSTLSKALGGVKIGKKLGKEIADGVASSEADVKKAMDGYAKLYDRHADSLGKVKTAQAQYNQVLKSGNEARVTAASERLEKAKRDEARALREARDSYKDYERAAESASNAGKDLGGGLLDRIKGLASGAKSGGTDAAAGFVEGFGGPIAALGTKAGPIGLALAAAAALGVGAGGLIAKQVLAGMEQEQQQADVAAKLGLTPEQMKPIADASAAAYAENFGTSVAENMDAARVAIQSGLLDPGATEADTQKMVEQLSTVSNVMGEEIPATARAAQQAIRTGLVGDATGAFDLFVKAQQSGLNISEDFLDTVTEYGTQFRKLGLDGPEAIGLISQAVKGGARDTDVAADAIKEFSIRAIDGSKSTTDAYAALGLNADEMAAKIAQGGPTAKAAFDQVIDAVRGVTDPVKQAQIAVGLFGTQSEDLGAALSTMDLSTAVEQLGAVDGAAQKAADTMGNTTASSVESAKRSIETASNSMQQSLAAAFGPTLEQGAGWIVEHQDDIADAFKWAAGGATEFGGAVVGMTGGVVTGFGYMVGALGDTVGYMLDGFEQMTGAAATVAGALGLDGLEGDLRGAQAQLGVWSDQFHGWGEGLVDMGGKITQAGINLHDLDLNAAGATTSIKNAHGETAAFGDALGAIPSSKQVDLQAKVTYIDAAGRIIDPSLLKIGGTLGVTQQTAAMPTGVPGWGIPGHAKGGVLPGYSPGIDNMLVPMSGGEGVLIPEATRAIGGAPTVNAINRIFGHGYASGGVVGPDVAAAMSMVGTKYSQGSRTDCSGMVARVIARAMGLPESGLMSTQNAAQWLAERGFRPGVGGPGTISVGWYNHGPNPNDGHMAMTLSDGTNAESGGSSGPFTIGGSAAGADSPQFDQHMYLPTVYGEGPGSSGSTTVAGGGAGLGGGSAGVGPNGEPGTYSVNQADVAQKRARVAEADADIREKEAKLRELDADAKESDRIRAQADVDKAKADKAKAESDLTEAQQGKFTAAKGGGKSGGGNSPLKEGLGILAGGLKETLGIGDWLPDLADNPWLKGADAFIGTAVGLANAYGDGSWTPGGLLGQAMGFGDGGATTSGAPFGIEAPPMPPPGVHTGSGAAPGPATQVTIDQSINGSQVGWDPATTMKQRDEGLKRAIPRIPVGV